MTAQQLKNSILQMAVQGKLVPQDPNDEPASVLIERIRAEKEKLIKEKKIKREKNPSVIFRGADNIPYEKIGNEVVPLDVPFDIPDSWEWVRLSDIVVKEIKRGKSPKYVEYSNVYVFAQKCNVKAGGIDISLSKYLDMSTLNKYPVEEYMRDGDIVVNSTGNGTLGRIGLFRDSDRLDNNVIVPDSHVTVVRACSAINTDYLFYVLKYHQPALEKLGEGSTNQTELKPSNIAELLIPFPPINEQIRIATKLSEVDSLIVAYGNSSAKLDAYNKSFPEQLKKSILQWAVQGKLVPQDEDDEPAEVLLERIRAEKEALIKAGKIKRDKHESIIFRRDNSHYEKLDGIERCIDDEIPFEIPENWSWARFGAVMINRDSERIPLSVDQRRNLDKVYDYYGASGIIDKVDRYLFDKPLLLIGEDGANLLTRSTPIAFIASGRYWVNNHAHVLDVVGGLCLEYIATFINAISLAPYVTGTAQPKMNQEKMNSILVAIPPVTEQVRILSKVNLLMDTIKKT